MDMLCHVQIHIEHAVYYLEVSFCTFFVGNANDVEDSEAKKQTAESIRQLREKKRILSHYGTMAAILSEPTGQHISTVEQGEEHPVCER